MSSINSAKRFLDPNTDRDSGALDPNFKPDFHENLCRSDVLVGGSWAIFSALSKILSKSVHNLLKYTAN